MIEIIDNIQHKSVRQAAAVSSRRRVQGIQLEGANCVLRTRQVTMSGSVKAQRLEHHLYRESVDNLL